MRECDCSVGIDVVVVGWGGVGVWGGLESQESYGQSLSIVVSLFRVGGGAGARGCGAATFTHCASLAVGAEFRYGIQIETAHWARRVLYTAVDSSWQQHAFTHEYTAMFSPFSTTHQPTRKQDVV